MVDLSGLRDIHIPEEPSWWPLAIGWWIVIGAVIIISIIGTIIFLKWYHHPRQYALRELKKTYEESSNIILLARCISILLKRIALMQYPRTKVAALSDEKWRQFLIQKTGKTFSDTQLNLLAEATYMPEQNLPADDSKDLYEATRKAILKLFGEKAHGRKSTKYS